MLIQTNWRFWLCAIAIFIVIRLRPPIRPSSWWGLLNLVALALLLGIKGLALVCAFSAALWSILRFAERRPALKTGTYAFVIAAIAVMLILLWQKIFFEIAVASGPSTPLISSLRVLELVSFSYIALRAWDVVSAVRDGERLLNPIGLSAYLSPFFMMPAGPINVYRDHLEVDKTDTFAPPTWSNFLRGAELIVYGLFLKFVLAEIIRLYVVGLNGSWPTQNYFDSLISFFYIYLDFSGYSLLALGIGRLLGVPTPLNFDRPLLATSLTDFWTRWHMSLGMWVKRNVYFPLQMFLLRRTPENAAYAVNTISLMAGFTFVGLWHRMTFPFLLWGILFGCLLSVEKLVRDKFVIPLTERRPLLAQLVRVLGPIYVVAVVVAMLHITVMGQMVDNTQ